MSLRLVSLNVQVSEHLDPVSRLLRQARPDVACLQEVSEDDVEFFAASMGATHYRFVAMAEERRGKETSIVGVGIFSLLPATFESRYYSGSTGLVPKMDSSDSRTFTNKSHLLLAAHVDATDKCYMVANTHFTWSGNGQPTDLQRDHVGEMLRKLEGDELVLCGDFNAPRGGEIFGAISQKYHDAVPATYVTSLDPELHRAAKTNPAAIADKMVDGIFTSSSYRVSDVALHFGISDHAAITATIERM